MNNKNTVNKEFNISDYLYLIFSKKYLFFFIFMITCSAVILFSFLMKKKYAASSTILIEKEKVLNPLERQTHRQLKPQEVKNNLKTLKQILLSRSRLLQVIKKLDLDLDIRTPLELQNLIEKMRDSIEISMITDSLFHISYEGEDPEEVRNIVNALSSLFIEENLERIRGMANDAFTFIKSQLEIYRQKLEDSENSLRIFKEKNMGRLPGEENINLNRLEQYFTLFTQAEIDLKESKLKRAYLEKQLSKEKPLVAFISPEDDSLLESRLIQLETRLSLLLTKYTDQYPELIRVRGQIEEVKKQLVAENGNNEDTSIDEAGVKTEALNPIYQKIKEELGQIKILISTLQSRMKDYQQKIEYYQSQVASIPKQEQELARLKRNYEVNNSIYQTLLNKVEEARIARELEMKEKSVKCQIIDAAQLPMVPSRPDRPKLILLSLVFGLGMALGIFYLLYYFDDSVTNIEDARDYFHYPILTGIPQIICPEDTIKKRRSNFIFYPMVGLFITFTIVLMVLEFMKR